MLFLDKGRIGKFTSSRISDLMGIKGIGKTGESYAKTKAIELFTGSFDEGFSNLDTARGLELEPYAFNKAKEIFALELKKVYESRIIQYDSNNASTPDGFINEDTVLEIKCPRQGKVLDFIAEGVSALDKNWIDQVQHQMMCSKRDYAVIFLYCIINGDEVYHYDTINRDDLRIQLMIERVGEAANFRDNYLTRINNNKKF